MDLNIAIPIAVRRKENILSPKLSGFSCIPAPTSPFQVEMFSGGFCFSFPFYENGGKKKKCLRLWHDDDSRKEILRHILNISNFFSRNKIKYVLPYKYEEEVLRLEEGNTIIPGVVMDWVEGDKLIDYVKKNYENSSLMKQLASRFLEMVKYLNSHGMAHGDLSGENIIVDPSGELVLVDYDSFYIKGYVEGVRQITAGIPCYQHPERNTTQLLSREMDYFSQQVIYLSILAISEDPSIFDENSDKGLLFSEEDINKDDFVQCDTYKRISYIKNDKVQYCLKELKRAISGPLSAVRSIADFEISRFEKSLMATYCDFCGHRFEKPEDKYCPICGRKRDSL